MISFYLQLNRNRLLVLFVEKIEYSQTNVIFDPNNFFLYFFAYIPCNLTLVLNITFCYEFYFVISYVFIIFFVDLLIPYKLNSFR